MDRSLSQVHNRRMLLRTTIVPTLLLGLLTACASPYYLVQSRLVESDRGDKGAEVTETSLYQEFARRMRVVGLRPPDVCKEGSIAAGTRDETGDARMIRTSCGVEMAEFERALARQGYVVISWNLIRRKAETENRPALLAARELGVDALLQLNALERGITLPGQDARWERSFHHSNARGEAVEPASVERARARRFVALVRPEEERLGAQRLTATVNASVIRVSDGAALWFYRRTLVDATLVDPYAKVLVYCEDDVCSPTASRAAVSAGPVQGDVELFSRVGDPRDLAEATYQLLIRDVVADLVARLSAH